MNALRARLIARRALSPSVVRPFSTTRSAAKESQNSPGDTHTTKKPHELDPQAKGAAQGLQSKSDEQGLTQAGGVDNATASKDTQNVAARTKEEFPEAPDTVIGMQDERGKRE